MKIGNEYEIKSVLCLSGNTITGIYRLVGTTKLDGMDCAVLKEEFSPLLEIAPISEINL